MLGLRTSYGDRAAEAVDHGKWQYIREDHLVPVVDSFFATRIFGPKRLAHSRLRVRRSPTSWGAAKATKASGSPTSSARSNAGSSPSSPQSRR